MTDKIRAIFCYRKMFSDGKSSAGFITEQRLGERIDIDEEFEIEL